MNVPKLRFKEFSGEWDRYYIGDITTKVGSGSTPKGGQQIYQSTGVPFIRSQNVNNDRLILSDVTYISDTIHNQMKGSWVKPLDILLNITGASIGRSCVVPLDFQVGNVNQHVCIIRLNDQFSSNFIQSYLSSDRGQEKVLSSQVGGGREGLNFQAIRKFELAIPLIPEQTKIASFLTVIDEKIAQLTQKHELLSQYKKGVMQQIFSQELRFKDDNGEEFGEWEEKTLGEISERCTKKNKDNLFSMVLTNSASQGIVYQHEYFERDIANQNNLTGYYIVEKNNFVYNPRISVYAPVGPIKRNHLGVGVMSPLYTVFNIIQGDRAFFEFYFLTNFWHDYMKGIANTGARHDRMNITNNDFYSLPLPFPSVREQTKIASFLSSIDHKIDQVAAQLDAAKQYKRGLLQQMFV